MKVILKKDVEKLGEEGAILEVKNGYARNYLLPNNLAIVASSGNMKTWENEKKTRERRVAKNTEKAKNLADSLSQKNFTIKAKAGEEGKLYGSVTSQDIVELVLAQAKIELDRKKLTLAEPIKKTGSYKVPVKLFKGVTAEISLEVAPEE
ncbi:MAG: 50S ribosomal protein L9 [Candidatus Eremiobacteraeota bacterium]|nr:50S ribosomal protein L9 [Candidatus Eremiobacteraeota bacterium]